MTKIFKRTLARLWESRFSHLKRACSHILGNQDGVLGERVEQSVADSTALPERGSVSSAGDLLETLDGIESQDRSRIKREKQTQEGTRNKDDF